jgi:hypothetical protein
MPKTATISSRVGAAIFRRESMLQSKVRFVRAAAVALASVLVLAANADEQLIVEYTESFSNSTQTDLLGDEFRMVFATTPPDVPVGFVVNPRVLTRTFTSADIGTVFSVDLTSPAIAEPVGRLVNGINGDLHAIVEATQVGGFGAGADEARRESTVFTGATDPYGSPLPGPDLAGFVPTRLEMVLNSIALRVSSPSNLVEGSMTVRIYADTPPVDGIDLTNVGFWDPIGDIDNVKRTYDLAAAEGLPPGTPLELESIAWDVVLTTDAPSWASEATMAFDFDGDGIAELTLAVSDDQFPVTAQRYTSDGPVFFSDVGIANQFTPDGTVTIEFHETFDDFPNLPEAFYDPVSSVSFGVVQSPSPCNAADLSEPLGVLDLSDISAFASAFVGNDPVADLNADGIFDLTDITGFVTLFNQGCP